MTRRNILQGLGLLLVSVFSRTSIIDTLSKWLSKAAREHHDSTGPDTVVMGHTWFVNSCTGVDAMGYGHSPDKPFRSTAAALDSAALAVRPYDVIYIL